jgi:heme exporter protein A
MHQLTADNLHLWRGDAHVLRGVSFTLEAGVCLQVTGANGAGKTTLLRALCGLVPLEAGAVRWCGLSIDADPAAFHAALAYLAHDNGLKGDLSAEENLRFSVGLRRPLTSAELNAAVARVGLSAQRALPLRQLSAGQRRRAALARLMLLEVPLWILDEPASNLDAAGQSLVQEVLQAHVERGGLAVVATHQPLGLRMGVQSVTLQ